MELESEKMKTPGIETLKNEINLLKMSLVAEKGRKNTLEEKYRTLLTKDVKNVSNEE